MDPSFHEWFESIDLDAEIVKIVKIGPPNEQPIKALMRLAFEAGYNHVDEVPPTGGLKPLDDKYVNKNWKP